MVHFLHQGLAKALNTSLEQSAKWPEILFKRLKSSESDQKNGARMHLLRDPHLLYLGLK